MSDSHVKADRFRKFAVILQCVFSPDIRVGARRNRNKMFAGTNEPGYAEEGNRLYASQYRICNGPFL